MAGTAIGSIFAALTLDFHSEPRFVLGERGKIVPSADFGLRIEHASFLAHFRRPIADAADASDNDRLRRSLLDDFALDRPRLKLLGTFASDRERLVAYLLLRVNGSMPTFDPTRPLDTERDALLRSPVGNCSHLAARLGVVLELFGLKCRVVSWLSPALEGHVFVSAIDPSDGSAYFLDSTSNLMARAGPESNQRWFLDRLETMQPADRRGLLQTKLRKFPCLFFKLQAEWLDESLWAVNNELRARDSALSALTYDLSIARTRWESGQQPPPQRITEFLVRNGMVVDSSVAGDGE